MTNYRSTFIGPDEPIRKALEIIDQGSQQIALVIDVNGCLLGTLTDGDVRRGLLRGLRLEDPTANVMNRNPTTGSSGQSRDVILKTMAQRDIHHLPIVDEKGRVIGLERFEELLRSQEQHATVVLMAGGLGTRLFPLTQQMPKPLIAVGGRPLLETTINLFSEQGFRNVVLAVNYKAEMIKDHFQDGSQFGVSISYVEEVDRLGTAGALSLLGKQYPAPVIVMNGDILTTLDFSKLLKFHTDCAVPATVCIREHTYQIPYGVVRIENDRLSVIEEKPSQSAFVSAGVYVLERSALDLLAEGVMYDMPDLIMQVHAKLEPPALYPIREYWLDVGRLEDLAKARSDFSEIFG